MACTNPVNDYHNEGIPKVLDNVKKNLQTRGIKYQEILNNWNVKRKGVNS